MIGGGPKPRAGLAGQCRAPISDGMIWMYKRLRCRHRLLASLITVGLIIVGLATPAPAAKSGKEAVPTHEDGENATLLRAIEANLNGVRTLQANFIQVAPDGTVSDGKFYLSRPGRIRFEYNPPSRLLIVSHDKWITLIDYDINQVSRWPINDTPFGILVGKTIRFGKTIGVTGLERAPGLVSVTLYKKADPKAGSVKLIFTNPPLQLRQWEVTDGRGQVTRVGLTDVQINMAIADSQFQFKDPRRKRRSRRGR